MESSPPPPPRDVQVQVCLAGGHQYTTWLSSDAPLLHDLFAALMTNGGGANGGTPEFFQLPLDGGRAACSFSSTQLISLITEPPVLVQAEAPSMQAEPQATPQVVAPLAAPAAYLQIDNFLTPDEHYQVLSYTLQHASYFKVSEVTTGEEEARHSQVYYDVQHSPWANVFLRRLRVLLPFVLHQFHHPAFPIGNIEVQLTAHNQGDYFRLHSDSGPNDGVAHREVTYVYYFYREPKPFSGGELRLYDGRWENGVYVADPDSFKVIEPRNNSLVIFLSHCFHEVMPVQSASPVFADCRFTINGWVNRVPDAADVPETSDVAAHASV